MANLACSIKTVISYIMYFGERRHLIFLSVTVIIRLKTIMMLLGLFVLLGLLASNHLGGAYHVRFPATASCAPSINGVHHSNSRLLLMVGSDNANHHTVPSIPVQLRKALASGIVAISAGLSVQLLPPLTTAAYAVVTSGDDAVAAPTAPTAAPVVIEKVPLLTKRTSDLQQYADIARGFKLLR